MANVVDQKGVAVIPAPQTPYGSEIILKERPFQIRARAIFGRQPERMFDAKEEHRLPEGRIPIEGAPSIAFAEIMVERMIWQRLKEIRLPISRIVRTSFRLRFFSILSQNWR